MTPAHSPRTTDTDGETCTPLPPTVPELIRMLATQRPEEWALHAPGFDWRFADLARHMQAATAELAARGVVAGDRLGILSENSASAIVLWLAAQQLGAWPSVINARLPLAEIRRMADYADMRWLAASSEGSEHTAAHAEALQAEPLPVAGLGPLHWVAYRPDAAPEPAPVTPAEGVGTLIFTSGTTGLPKAVMLSHRALLTLGQVTARARALKPGELIEVASPLSHIMGLSPVLMGWVSAATLRLRPRLAPDSVARAVASGELRHLLMVPVGWVRLLDQIEREGIDVSGHRLLSMASAGAPLDPALKQRVQAVFGGALVNSYGASEMGPMARNRDAVTTPGSIGRPDEGIEMRIVDAQGNEVPFGEVGEIQVRSPSMMLGYYRQPEATREVLLDGGWYATGDLGRRLPDGEVAIAGRRKEMIIRSGFNVYPAEVEAAITTHPDVLQAAVVGAPGEQGDERVIAFVQLREGVAGGDDTLARLAAHVRRELAPYKCPSRFILVDAMPLGATGKIQKRDLVLPAEATGQAAGSPRIG